MADQALERSFSEAVDEGAQRLHRSWPSLLSTGAVGGFDIGVGLLAYLLVLHETRNHVAAALAFGIGFVVLAIAKSELLTENFLLPVVAVLAGRAEVRQMVRLWTGTLAANLLGGLVIVSLVVAGYPELHDTLLESATHYPEQGISLRSFALAMIGGGIITLMTWVETSADSSVGRIFTAWTLGALLVLGPVNHVVVVSIEMFGAMIIGAPFGLADWLGFATWVTIGNIVGGVLLVTPLRTIQAGGEQLRREKQRSETAPTAGDETVEGRPAADPAMS